MSKPQDWNALLEDMPDAIAIVGASARLPGAKNLEAFKSLLLNGECAIRPVAAERLERSHHAEMAKRDNYVAMTATLDEVEYFDAGFFDLSPREALLIDPQQRHILECAWHAFEDAGIIPGDDDEQRTGVFTSVSFSSYLSHYLLPRMQKGLVDIVEAGLSNNVDYAAARVAYKLNLSGPALAIQTACSSSLVATHIACRSLVEGECDLALVAASSITVPNGLGYLASDKGMLAPDGICRPFSSDAQGTLFANGAGALLLRRLEDALSDGDNIRGIIRGSAINNDGSARVGFTAPSIDGQNAVISEALGAAEVAPDQIGYIEAHGTGTPLGDPIEVTALNDALAGFGLSAGRKIPLGAVKGNVGHLDTVAGLAGLLKIILAFETERIPATLHLTRPNPELALDDKAIRLVTERESWPRGDAPRIAGLSSFGMGGSNAHAVIQEPPTRHSSGPARDNELMIFSARDHEATHAQAGHLATHCEASPQEALADIAHTLRHGRRAFDARCFLVAATKEEAAQALEQGRYQRALLKQPSGKVAFVLPGQGSQYPDLCAGLRAAEPNFARHHDHLRDLILANGGPDITQTGLSPDDTRSTDMAQPLLFAAGVALGRTMADFGITPDVYIGHSIGELAVACLTGVLTDEDAVTLLLARAQSMAMAPTGSMIQLFCPLDKAQAFIDEARQTSEDVLTAAVINAPSAIVVGGDHASVDRLQAIVEASGVDCTRLRTSHAFHTSLMQTAADQIAETAATLRFAPATGSVISTVTGRHATTDTFNADYWADQILKPVRFDDALQTALDGGVDCFLELGPPGGLDACLTQIQGQRAQKTQTRRLQFHASSALLAHARDSQRTDADQRAFLEGIGRLWLAGKSPDWQAFDRDFLPRARCALPGYPFKRERHWPEEDGVSTDVNKSRESNASNSSETLLFPRQDRPDTAPDFVTPNGQTETLLAGLWEELLLIAPIGREDDFIAMGGASITALQLVQLAASQDHNLTVREIFENRVLKDLAAVLNDKRAAPASSTPSTTLPELDDNDDDFLDLETLGTIQAQIGSHS